MTINTDVLSGALLGLFVGLSFIYFSILDFVNSNHFKQKWQIKLVFFTNVILTIILVSAFSRLPLIIPSGDWTTAIITSLVCGIIIFYIIIPDKKLFKKFKQKWKTLQ